MAFRRALLAVLAPLALLPLAGALAGQDRSPPRPGGVETWLDEEDEGALSVSGAFLGVVGMLGGAAIGSGLSRSRCGAEGCSGRGAAVGALVGGAVGVPLGVHLANRARGNFGLGLAASVAIGAASYGLMHALPGRPVALSVFFATPAQLFGVSALERRGRRASGG